MKRSKKRMDRDLLPFMSGKWHCMGWPFVARHVGYIVVDLFFIS